MIPGHVMHGILCIVVHVLESNDFTSPLIAALDSPTSCGCHPNSLCRSCSSSFAVFVVMCVFISVLSFYRIRLTIASFALYGDAVPMHRSSLLFECHGHLHLSLIPYFLLLALQSLLRLASYKAGSIACIVPMAVYTLCFS